MGVSLQLRRGTTAEVSSFATGKEGELILDTETHILYVIDGSGGKFPISGSGGSGSGGSGSGSGGTGETEWANMPVYDAAADTLTVTNEDGSTTVIDLVPPLLVTPELNSIIADAIATIPAASGLTITDLNTLQAQLESKIDLDNQIQDDTITAVSDIVTAQQQSIAVLSASATATAAEVEASIVADLYAQLGTNTAGLQTELNVRALADLTITQSVVNLQAEFDDNAATVESTLTALTTADSSTAQALTTLDTSFGTLDNSVATLSQDLSAVSTEAAASTAAITTMNARVGDVEGDISSLSQIVANSDGSVVASNLETLTTTVGEYTATVQDNSESINGIEAKRTISINAGGDVVGFEMLGNSVLNTNSIKFNTDNFVVAGSGAEDRAPFTISEGNVSIDGDLIATGTLSAASIDTNGITCSMITNGTANVTGGGFSLGGAGGTIGGHTGVMAAVSTSGSKWGSIHAMNSSGEAGAIGAGSMGGPAIVAVFGGGPSYAPGTISTQANLAAAGNVGASFVGDIHGNGGTYLPFTGSHQALIESVGEVGDIVIDVEVIAKESISDTITIVEVSTLPNQKGVVGVYAKTFAESVIPHAISTPVDGDYMKRFVKPAFSQVYEACELVSINSLGEGQVNVCGEGGNLEIGDLIVTSSIQGKGKKQGDDIIRSTTVAKVRENVTFSTYSEVKQVACIYLCG